MLLKVDPSVRGVEPAFSVISFFLALQLAIESPILENKNMYISINHQNACTTIQYDTNPIWLLVIYNVYLERMITLAMTKHSPGSA